MTYLVGIDVSTTAVKALMTDAAGAVVGVASTDTPLQIPQPLWSEQDPADWWRGAQQSLRRLLVHTGVGGDEIAAIGLTGQMHSLTVLDEAGEVLRPAILWSDQRTGPQCDEIRRRLGKERLIALTGNDALTGFTAPKILWVREHEPQLYARARQFLLPKDYLRFRLTGAYATDRAGGAGTLLFDVQARDWSPEVLSALGIDPSLLPPTFEGPEVTGLVTPEAARATGLRAGTPVVAGGGDQAAQAVGVGAVHPDIAALTLGTGAVIFVSSDAPFIEPAGRLHAFCHAVPGRWHSMGVTLSAGGSLRWWRDLLRPEADFDTILAPAADVPPGSDGLLFMPYLCGERTPHGDPLARGGFIGLTLRHGPAHLTRAILEGVACGVRDSLTLMRDAGLPPSHQVRVSGGGARSAPRRGLACRGRRRPLARRRRRLRLCRPCDRVNCSSPGSSSRLRCPLCALSPPLSGTAFADARPEPAGGQEGNPHVKSKKAPYSQSDYIIGLTWDDRVIRTGLGPIVNQDTQRRDGSDNWPITWADDGELYVTYGDGYGFVPYLKGKLGLGFARISGGPETLCAVNIRSASGENAGYGRRGKKGSGLLMVDGVLTLWLFHADERGGQAQLAVSKDHAVTWTFAHWKFEGFGLCTFINFGQDYSGARDNYVYTVTHDGPMADGPADRMILMRVPKDRITDRSAYEFYVETDATGDPIWDRDIDRRGAVFAHTDACLRSGISYCAPLERYLWWQHIPQPPGHRDRGDTRFDGGFGIYEAPEPWGPWRTVYFTEGWDVGPGERAEFPTKWMSADGRTLHLTFSGDDNFCIRKATLEIASPSLNATIKEKKDEHIPVL